MPNIRLVLEYDGAGFHGWQVQPGLRTIQGELHRVLEIVTREKITVVHASGRTDAGVHARGQVATFKVQNVPDLYRLKHAVSGLLKGEVAVLDASVVNDDFHPRFSAKKKQYSYTILNRAAPATIDAGHVWHVSSHLDIPRMQHEALLLVGTHNFTSFKNYGCKSKAPDKTVFESSMCEEGDRIIYRIIGSGFLKQMVRNIVGTLVQMGRGEFGDTSMSSILEAKDRQKAGVTAPPYGLCLDWVQY